MAIYEVETVNGTLFNFVIEKDGKTTFTMMGSRLVSGLVKRFAQKVEIGKPVEMDFYRERSMTCPHQLSRYQADVSYIRSGLVKRITQIAVPASVTRT